MEGLIQVFGIGIAIFLMLFISFNIDEKKHFLFKLVTLFFAIGLLLLLPKTAMDYKNHCEFVVVNVENSAPNDIYTYDYVCSNNPNTTANTFYNSVLWFTRIFMIYVGLYFAWEVLKWISDIVRGIKSGD